MKYLNDKLAMKGDAVITVTPDGYAVAGVVHELYERNQTLRISGYALQVKAEDCVLALDAYAAISERILAKRKADKEAAAEPPKEPEQPPQNTPPASESAQQS